jgi:hypothetical protein
LVEGTVVGAEMSTEVLVEAEGTGEMLVALVPQPTSKAENKKAIKITVITIKLRLLK